MNSFRNSFRQHLRKPSALFSGTVIASSAAATCLYFINDEKNNFFEATTTTQCLGIDSFTGFFKASQNDTDNENKNENENDRPHLLFLGTGSSTGCPKPLCAMKKFSEIQKTSSRDKIDPKDCRISHLALKGGDPKSNKNYRNNPCLLIHHYDKTSKMYKNIVIDVGKTFRETALRWFPIHSVKSLDAIILTHHHMDAVAGLDDVRGFQQRGVATPLYLSDFCHLNLQGQFPWLLPGGKKMPLQSKHRPTVKRHTAAFDVTIFEDYKQEIINGFEFTPLPVWHGDDLISHGFAFSLQPGPTSKKPLNVVYLSDISRMVPETLEFIKKKLPPTDILIVDSLLWEKDHSVHFSMKQAIELAQTIQPRQTTYLIGMSCDNFLPHDEMNAYLKETYGNSNSGDIAMAHDGLVVELTTN